MDMILNISISNMAVVLIVISIVVLLLGIVIIFLTVKLCKKKKNNPDYHVINDDEITVYISSFRGRPMKELYISRTYVRKNDKWILSPQYAAKVKFYLKSVWIILAVWAVLTIAFLAFVNELSHLSSNEFAIAFVFSMVFIILIILPGYFGIYYDYYTCRKYLKKHGL